jgi:hypothetical protein
MLGRIGFPEIDVPHKVVVIKKHPSGTTDEQVTLFENVLLPEDLLNVRD